MPSAWISMSLWSLWKSSTIAFTAARVAGLGSVSHIVTTILFCARAGRASPMKDAAAAPAAVPPSRARNARRPRTPSCFSATRRRTPGSLSQRFMALLLFQSGRARDGPPRLYLDRRRAATLSLPRGGSTMQARMSRRAFLSGAAAMSTVGTAGIAAAVEGKSAQPAAGKLPARGEFVIRGAYVMTMDPTVGDIARGDVHVKAGAIVAVGADLKAAGAQVIDGRGTIVLPGFVDTHWHMWNTLLRSMAGDKRELGYFPTVATLGKVFTPDDMYQGTRLSAAEALSSGFTFVHDWCHNVRGPDFAVANLRALKESGLRGRFSYGTPQAHPPTETIDLVDFERLGHDWKSHANGGLLDLGLAWRGMGAAPAPIPPEVYRKEFDTARAAGLPISVHVANLRSRAGQVDALAKANLLGKDVQVIHAIWITPEEIQSLAAAGSSVSLSPYTELRIGFGFPRTGERADLIMVSTRDVNIGVFTDPAHTLVEAAQPSNVDTVVVDGRILKRRGKLTAFDTGRVVGEASAALTAVRKRGNWW